MNAFLVNFFFLFSKRIPPMKLEKMCWLTVGTGQVLVGLVSDLGAASGFLGEPVVPSLSLEAHWKSKGIGSS